MAPDLHAVLTADVIASGARRRLRPTLSSLLARASRLHQRRKWIRLPYAVTAGDEFQAIATRPGCVPRLVLDLRRRMRPLDLRIGIGFGKVNARIAAPVNRLDGEAFRLARQAMESLARPGAHGLPALTVFRTPNAEFNATINLIYALVDTLVSKITQRQWETIGARMDSRTVEDAARAMGLDISTVSRNLKRGYYGQLLATAAGAEALIQRHF